MLSSKLRIAVWPKKLVAYPEKKVGFYMKYASLVLKTLRRSSFQKFLRWMLKREKIEEGKIRDIQVRVLPLQKDNGTALVGKCNSNGEIFIYPKKLEFCQKIMQEYGMEVALSYIKSRAIAALIHELLHAKYLGDEEKVRELTRKYFGIFSKNRNPQDSNAYNVAEILFKERARI